MTEQHATPLITATLHQPVVIPQSSYTLTWTYPDRLDDGELQSIAALLTRAFNGEWGWAEPLGHLKWKVLDYPGQTAMRIIRDGDRIIGTQARVWRRFLVTGQERAVSEGVDDAIDPDYQGRGLKTKRRAVGPPTDLPGRCLSIGFGTHPTSNTRRGIQRERVPLATKLEAWTRPVTVWGLVRSRLRPHRRQVGKSRTAAVLDARAPVPLLDRLGGSLAMSLNVLRSLVARRRTAGGEHISVSSFERFHSEFDAFWPEAAKPFALIQVRDPEYLNWRYAATNAGPFTLRRADEGDRLIGYAAMRVSRDEAVLADLLVLPDRADAARALLDDALALARAAGAPHLRTWMTDTHPYRPLLEEAGFFSYPQQMTLNVRPRDCALEELTALSEADAAIHMMPADSDHI